MSRRKQTRRKFSATVTVDVEIEIEEDLLKEVMKEDWQKDFYRFVDRNEAAAHIIFNLVQGRPLTSLDGFAHREPEDAKIVDSNWQVDDGVIDIGGEPGG